VAPISVSDRHCRHGAGDLGVNQVPAAWRPVSQCQIAIAVMAQVI